MKNLKLIAALIIIVGIIWYIESTKPVPSASSPEKIAIPAKIEDRFEVIQKKASQYPSAIELIPGGKFINSDQFKLKDLIGKNVILIDFWTYSCINCLRTLPYLKNWYDKYKDSGLVIVGVHTPEFDFEKDYDNVAKAVKDLGVNYPVMQDNDYATWNAYKNQYWPREYLIDIDGYIVHDHAGEGGYEDTEKLIQNALEERAAVLHEKGISGTGITNPSDAIQTEPSQIGSPETYFGSARNEFLTNSTPGLAGEQNLNVPAVLNSNSLYLGGTWDFNSQFAENKSSGAEIDFKYNSKNVYFVASSDQGVNVKVLVDGKEQGNILVKDHKLYQVVKGSDYGEHTLKLIIEKPGLDAFTFTFG